MTAQQNQTQLDLAIIGTGTAESLFALAIANNKSITDIPAPGTEYIIPGGIVKDNNTLQYLSGNNLIIGTKGETFPMGLGFWKIAIDFIVS